MAQASATVATAGASGGLDVVLTFPQAANYTPEGTDNDVFFQAMSCLESLPGEEPAAQVF